MKNSAFTILLLLLATSFTAMAQDKKNVSGGPGIVLAESTYDFGPIEEGPDYTHVFKFTNTGTAALLIHNVNTPCGCTSPKWSKEPIQPGQTGEITATYHSSGRAGVFTKTLSIQSNAGEGKDQFVTIRGEVKPKNQSHNSAASGATQGH